MGFAFNRLRERTDDPYSKSQSGRGFFMIIHLFRNRWYRIYFQLSDAFDKERCSLCCLLSQKERAIITTLFASYNPRKRRGIPLKALCALHRSRIKEGLANDPSFSTVLKKVVVASLRELTILQKHRRRPGSDGSMHRFCAVLYVVRFYVRREISVEV